jgi:hypothetical protein
MGRGRDEFNLRPPHLHSLEQIVSCHAGHAVVSDDETHVDLLQRVARTRQRLVGYRLERNRREQGGCQSEQAGERQ